MKLPNTPTHQMWDQLQWKPAQPVMTEGKNSPVSFPEVPSSAGLYRITLTDSSWWSKHAAKHLHAYASKRIPDPQVETSAWKCPVVLTIGKTTNLVKRLRQHLGANKNNNRLLRRLNNLFPTLGDDEIRAKSLKGLRFEIAELPDWRHRFLLERYGVAIHQPLLDFEAEH